MGIVVPYDRETQLGYRCLDPIGDRLRKLLDKAEKRDAGAVDELDATVNWANIANDECDFGASLQLGIDIFNHSLAFAPLAARTLSTAYTLLGRDEFATIVNLHLAQRKRAASDAS